MRLALPLWLSLAGAGVLAALIWALRRRWQRFPFPAAVNGRVPGSFFGSQVFNNFARILDEWLTMDPGLLEYYGGKSLMSQSHGQSLMAFFESRFKIKGLYLLDEPETALSPGSQLELLRLLKEMGAAGHAQFIIATHSPILLACPGAQIFSFDPPGIREVSYEDTTHFKVYQQFFAAQL